ncbi:hypothetical protein CBM2606_A40205 [Cupriavidus taiwanensis]|nr:hypothetical protein CBM2606_A40205 [Cupriavidus taiwanensis]
MAPGTESARPASAAPPAAAPAPRRYAPPAAPALARHRCRRRRARAASLPPPAAHRRWSRSCAPRPVACRAGARAACVRRLRAGRPGSRRGCGGRSARSGRRHGPGPGAVPWRIASISIGLLILPEIGSVRGQSGGLSFIPSGAETAPAESNLLNLLNLLKEIDHGRTDELARRGPRRLQGDDRRRGLPGALLAGNHAEGTGQDPRFADQRLRLLPGHARNRRAQARRKRAPPESAAGLA